MFEAESARFKRFQEGSLLERLASRPCRHRPSLKRDSSGASRANDTGHGETRKTAAAEVAHSANAGRVGE